MAWVGNCWTSRSVLVIICSHLVWVSAGEGSAAIAGGLSLNFYKSSCPKVEAVIRKQVKQVLKQDILEAGGLLRLHFHDCFVQGCDGSVLLEGSASEQSALPNLSLRKKSFEIVNDLRTLLHKECGPVVSCSDILALAARDAVFLSGGPDYTIPLGRRDGLNFASQTATLSSLPPPFANTTTLLAAFAAKSFDATDLVALSGAHTIGMSHCNSFTSRLSPQDPTMDKSFANKLKSICPTPNSPNTTVLDLRTPTAFDNKYYVDLMNRQGLFFSDQNLMTDARTRGIVASFAANQTLFFEKFVDAVVKMGQMGVLTGNVGEIRANCSAINSKSSANLLASVVVDQPVEGPEVLSKF